VYQALPGILLGDALVGVIAAGSLVTQNHQVVSFMALIVAAAALVGTIVLSAGRGLVGELRLALAGPNEPSHVHIPRRSTGETE
jgi:hypothetical protein